MKYKVTTPLYTNNNMDNPTKRLLERLETVAKKRYYLNDPDDLYEEGYVSGSNDVKEYVEECLYLYQQDKALFAIREQEMVQ